MIMSLLLLSEVWSALANLIYYPRAERIKCEVVTFTKERVYYRVSQNYPNMYFSTIISTALKPLKMWIPKFSEILIKRQRLNATHLPSPLMTPFSHYFRLALKICFSLCAQVPTRQLLTRGAFPDSTIERLTSYLLEGLQMKCETSWISVALKFSSS